jgi:hypothetical protein
LSKVEERSCSKKKSELGSMVGMEKMSVKKMEKMTFNEDRVVLGQFQKCG